MMCLHDSNDALYFPTETENHLCLWILVSCSSENLPEPGKVALDESIARLAGSELNYEIVSAQVTKGAGVAENFNFEARPAGICPADSNSGERWCVVIDQSVTDDTGRAISHFFVTRLGKSWDVERLAGSEAGLFQYYGCSNWDAAISE